MDAIRRIYETVPDTISVPPELRHRRVEVIILPLDEEHTESKSVKDSRDSAEFFGALPDFPERGSQGEYETRDYLP